MWTKVTTEQGALLGMSAEEFLASPRAKYMTGQPLSVDGGLVMH